MTTNYFKIINSENDLIYLGRTMLDLKDELREHKYKILENTDENLFYYHTNKMKFDILLTIRRNIFPSNELNVDKLNGLLSEHGIVNLNVMDILDSTTVPVWEINVGKLNQLLSRYVTVEFDITKAFERKPPILHADKLNEFLYKHGIDPSPFNVLSLLEKYGNRSCEWIFDLEKQGIDYEKLETDFFKTFEDEKIRLVESQHCVNPDKFKIELLEKFRYGSQRELRDRGVYWYDSLKYDNDEEREIRVINREKFWYDTIPQKREKPFHHTCFVPTYWR